MTHSLIASPGDDPLEALPTLAGWGFGSENPVETSSPPSLSPCTLSGSQVYPPPYEQAQLSESGSGSCPVVSKSWVAVEYDDDDVCRPSKLRPTLR